MGLINPTEGEISVKKVALKLRWPERICPVCVASGGRCDYAQMLTVP